LQAFTKMGKGDKDAMTTYNEFQVKQLTKLIEVTRTDLAKPDRQKIMCVDTSKPDKCKTISESLPKLQFLATERF
jgi:hypothetical protein